MRIGAIHHRKMTVLAEILKIPHAQAVGIITALFAWASTEVPTGAVGMYEDAQIAEACLWKGNPKTLIKALLTCFVPGFHSAGFLEENDTFRLVIHDWREHAENYVHERVERRGWRFWDNVKPRNRKPLRASVIRNPTETQTETQTKTQTETQTKPKTVVRQRARRRRDKQNKQVGLERSRSVKTDCCAVGKSDGARAKQPVCSVQKTSDAAAARAKVLGLLDDKEFQGRADRGSALMLLVAAGWKHDEAIGATDKYGPQHVVTCVRQAARKSKRNLGGWVRRALEENWTL